MLQYKAGYKYVDDGVHAQVVDYLHLSISSEVDQIPAGEIATEAEGSREALGQAGLRIDTS
jgi:hypothetical protein